MGSPGVVPICRNAGCPNPRPARKRKVFTFHVISPESFYVLRKIGAPVALGPETGHTDRVKTRGAGRWLGGAALLWAAAAAAADPAANVILFIGDGMGPEHVAAARCYKGAPLCFEKFPHSAVVDTDSLDGLTDSAAAASAIATGTRVSMWTYGDRVGSPLPTILEHFLGNGRRAGLVTTDYLTAATPAAFATHAYDRGDTAQIAEDYLRRIRPHVLLGGGGYDLDPESAWDAGFDVVTNAAELAAVDPAGTEYLCGQFGAGQMDYEYDGIGDEPHLRDMTATALAVLEQEPAGFFLMVEGANVDHAAHGWDLDRLIPEMLELDAAVQVAVDWAGSRTDTLIVVTADHETGGLSVVADNGEGVLPDVEWTDTWHTRTPVGSWAWGPGSERVSGSMANTNTFRVLRDSAGLQPFCLRPPLEEPAPQPPKWAAAPGDVVRIEYTDRIEPQDWQPLGTVTAATPFVAIDDTNAWPQAQRYYRAVAVP